MRDANGRRMRLKECKVSYIYSTYITLNTLNSGKKEPTA